MVKGVGEEVERLEAITLQALSEEVARDDRQRIEDRLQKELERLKKRTGMGQELKVVWQPKPSGELSGKVEGGLIYVYERDEGRALEVLRHEFVDYLVSQAIEPYRSAANRLVQLINEMCYRKKEEVVEALLRLL